MKDDKAPRSESAATELREAAAKNAPSIPEYNMTRNYKAPVSASAFSSEPVHVDAEGQRWVRSSMYDALLEAYEARSSTASIDVDWLANVIRTLDGDHTKPLGAGALAEKIVGVLAARSATAHSCEWEKDDDGLYHTGCGEVFFFDTGTAEENKAKFCQYCGGSMVTADRRAEKL